MKNKKIILISIIGLLIIGFFSLYNSLDIVDEQRGNPNNYFNKTLKRVVPQNIKDFIKDTIFVFKKVSILEQRLADRDNKIRDLLNDRQLFEFKKNEIKNKNNAK